MEMTPTIVNVVVFGVILLSAILAYARGLTRELVTLVVWLGSAWVALKFYKPVVPLVRDVQDLGEWTKWAALGLTFVLALIVFTLLGSFVSRLISNSPLRAVDKGLGFLFGAARGLLLLAVAWIGYQQIVEPEYTHESIEASKGGQLVADTAVWLEGFAPSEWPPFITAATEDLLGPSQPEDDPLPAGIAPTVPTPADATTES